MDRWEACIEEYQKFQTLDSIDSVLRTAEGILKEDLAPFELDWFIQTLLSEPVSLLCTISARLSDNAWTKILKDAYRLLSDLAENHYDAVEQYIDAIVLECQKPQEARTRARALQCLASCIKRSLSGANASQYIAELANASACKGPLALLVGTICEYHPEVVTDQYITIWRTYLNLLGSNKNTVLVCNSLLKGVWCLFKNFGSDIPLREISEFYDKLTRELLSKCESAVLQIVRDYAPLFKERLAADAALRRELWTCSDLSALAAVYREIATVLEPEMLQKILRTEIIPQTRQTHTNTKFTALRICSMYEDRGTRVRDMSPLDPCALEFELRSEVDYDTAEAVHWCIESNAPNSEKLLQTAILFYNNLPASKRKNIVVEGLLNAPTDVFNTTLNFLTTQSCHDETALLTFLPLWRDIFDSQLVERRNLLFEKYMENFLVVVDNFLDGADDMKLPDKLSTLLALTSHILTLQPSEDTCYLCAIIPSKLVSLSRACGLHAVMAAVARALIPHLEEDAGIYKIFQMIQIDNCKDETLLCEACLAITHEPDMVEPDVVLKALEVIFIRRDAEPKTLSQGIHTLEQLIVRENNNLDRSTVSKIIKLIDRLKSSKVMSGRDARILQRDVTLFLGKYWNTEEYTAPGNLEENSLIVRLKEALTLDIPHSVDGTTYKIKLNRLLYLALINEAEDALRMLINIICANLCSNTSPLLQQALGRAIVSLSRATVGATRQKVARDAAAFCDVDATMYILKEITVEKSPAVRRVLSDVIECILLKEQGTESNEALLKAVYKDVCAKMESDNSILKLGGLDITVSLLTALKANRHLSREMLPTLIILVSKTHEQDSNVVFDHASALYIENLALFQASEVDFTVAELFKNSLDSPFEITNDVKAKIFKNNVKSTLNFCKELKLDERSVIQKVFTQNRSAKFVYLWSELPKTFDIKDSLVDDILCERDSLVLDSVFNATDVRDEFALEAHLRFLNQYASVLLKSYSMQTLKHICNIIENLQPKYVKIHRRLLSDLLTHVRQILHSTPDMILKSFESWSDCVPVKEITEHLEKEKFLLNHAIPVNSLRIMVDIFKLKDPTAILTTVSIFSKTWPKAILKIYASGHIKYLKKEVPYLTDLLSLSLRFLTMTDVKNLILEGHGLPGENGNVGVEFCRFFISVFIKYLLKKPFILLQNGMEDCWVLLNDVVKWSVRKRWHDDQMENVLELLEQFWPAYVSKAPFTSQHALLLDLSCINRTLYSGSVAMRHAVAIVRDATSCDQRIAIVPLLPGGEACSEAYRRFASSLLPTRLSDMDATSSAALRALLDALAGTADTTLLDIVVTLALGDDTHGWWDDALTSCMSSLSSSPTFSTTLLTSLESRARESPSVCRRILLPLLRYASTSICDSFFASILKELLQSLGGSIKAPSIHPEYAACVQQRTIVLDLLQLLFEKVPASKIESPSSSLYEHVPTDKAWHLARVVISHCYKLRDKILIPEGATNALTNICREFQYAAYKCMCVCLCVRRPDAKMYNTVLEPQVWVRLVDESTVYELPLRTEWNQRKIVKSVSIRSDGRRRSLGSSRSRVFLRTLSENPLEFDLVDHDEEQVETQDILLPATSLSGHPVSGTLTALLAHLSAVSGCELSALCRSLETAGRNAVWLIAQAICNNREQFKQQATVLRPALLAALVNTREGGLNSLHIEILNTLIIWKDATLPDTAVSHLNTAIKSLVETALSNSHRTGLFRMLDDLLDNVLKVFGSCVLGDFAIDAGFDDPNKTKSYLKLLLRFSKNNVRVPNLLSMLLAKLEQNHRIYRTEMTMLAELIGIEISNSNDQEKRKAAEKLSIILKEIKKHNISDYVKILHHSGCCDLQQFRTIVDTTQKLPEADRKRCLRIISAYISQHPGCDEAGDVPPDIRQMADRVSGDRCFEELFKTTQQTQPPAKKARIEVTSSVLNTVGRKERLLNEALNLLGSEKVKKVCEKMSQDNMATRFVESFYLAIYLPLKYNTEKPDLSVCLSSFYELLFHHLKSLESFRSKRLRDEPWVVEHPIGLSRTLTNRVGTLRTFSYKTNHLNLADDELGVDVQVSIEVILDTLVQFAKATPEAGMELLTQLLRCLGRGFDSRPALAQLLSSLVVVAPQIVAVARECVDQLYCIDGFLRTVESLKKSTLGSEGEQIFRLLHEETVIRCRGTDQFVLGNTPKDEVSMVDEKEFAIDELESAFQTLSNWDELPIQDKRRLEDALPILWTERIEFKTLLDDYRDTNGYTNTWFGKMVSLYNDDRKDLMKWLRELERWPRRQFVISAVTEAMQWHTSDNQSFDIDKQLSTVIQKDDCLAEWAARLMLRNLYLADKSETEATMKLSRSHELRYCERANEMGLHNLALSVIERNYLELEEDETLQWMEQKMLASAAKGLTLNDHSELLKAVNISKFFPDYYRFSTPDVIIGVNMLKMKLEYELKSLSSTVIEDTMQLVETQVTRLNERGVTSHKNKNNLKKLYETAVLYYDGLWGENLENNEDILLKLCSYLGRFTSSKLDGAGVAAIVLNRLDECGTVSDTVASAILGKLKPIIADLPDCYMDQLRSKKSVFPADIIRSCGIRQIQEEPKIDKYKQCLQLLCDADYLLLKYCEELHKCLTEDPSKWDAIFSRMESRIFENQYAGPDYQALASYRPPLNEIKNAATSMKSIVLKGIMSELFIKPPRSVIRMSHVCLWESGIPDVALDRLLRLRRGESVVRVLDELQIFTDSERRPSVITVLTSSGKKRRYLLKNEDIRADAAVQCLSSGHLGYHVIPLSEDCGLIEYLEDHKRLRDLIASSCDVEIPIERQAAKDDELILAPKTSSIQNYNELCSKIPAYSLRAAIEELSASVEDFINKKRKFLESLCEVTISNWLFGLGDRHLQNLLYSIQDGGVVCIDWGAILKYGGAELPPARLTRNLLAVCDTKVLESKLQCILAALRDSNDFHLPVLKLSFKWSRNFDDNFVYIQGILRGKMVAHEITKDALRKSSKAHVSKYIELLDNVFSGHEDKEQYSVEEQVSKLLLHCTDPWILSITRTGWEPWL